MTRWTGPLFLTLVAAVALHMATILAIPSLIMDRAMSRMADSGIPLHAFRLAPRMTPQTQSVVRPSPDLAYSICRFDFTERAEPVDMTMAGYADYGSLSFFDADTDNFATVRGDGTAVDVRLYPAGGAARKAAGEHVSVTAPTSRGLILIRRLAPTRAAYGHVERISAGDRCGAT
ncbi:MAG: DUF1254 domain-containing protein [Pacificimonas sp.]